MMIDTSVDPDHIEMPPEGSEERLNWRQCTICDRLAPPRSWHCTECGVCILKRDHHCSFTGCCIGHRNQRYFMCFLLYLLVESFFALVYCSIYMWVLNGPEFWKVMIRQPALKFPITDFGIKVQLFLYTLHILAFISPLGALGHYIPLVLRVDFEKLGCVKLQNMRIRPRPLPGHLPEMFLFLTISLLVPLGWLYEILIVIPAIHEPGGFLYNFTVIFSAFMLLNIEGNLLASMIIDTSVDFESLVAPPNGTKELLEWRHCKDCDRLAPPRSWHCKLCGICILKRDHHCSFTGCCVGHQNHRYFMCFVLYTVVASVYMLIYNSYYMWILNGSIYVNLYIAILMNYFVQPWPHLTLYSSCTRPVCGEVMLEEIISFLLIGLLLPIILVYDILVVLPAIHEPGTASYKFIIVVASFIALNIEGNLIACMIVDTSVDRKRVEAATSGDNECIGWRHCSHCDRLAPPRSWHCKLCGVCILRRDHHCMFSGYCIGHRNHRYFICFLFYLMVGSLLSQIYCSIYVWIIQGANIFYIGFPRYFMNPIFTLFCILNIVLMVFSFIGFNFYVSLMLRGESSLLKKKNVQECNNHAAMDNLRTVLGQRFYVAWIFPLIKSQLPEDGYTWTKQMDPGVKSKE
ncbi:hypothetical protein ACLKA6_001986 [Drosophila palustris]